MVVVICKLYCVGAEKACQGGRGNSQTSTTGKQTMHSASRQEQEQPFKVVLGGLGHYQGIQSNCAIFVSA